MTIEAAPPTADAAIGERVHQLLWTRRIQQRDLAAHIGVGQASISRKLRGDRPWYAAELVSIAGYLEVSVGYLFGEHAEAPRPEGRGARVLPHLDSNQEPAD